MEISGRKTTVQELLKMAHSDMGMEVRMCEKHGEYKSYPVRGDLSVMTTCFKCYEDADRAQREAERLKWQQELKDRDWNAKLGRAAIPGRFKDRSLENYIPICPGSKKALSVASRYASNFDEALKTGASLIFCGDVGTGKTHLAVGIAHEIMKAGKQAVFTSVMRAVRSVKETYSKGSDRTEAEAIKDLVSPELLILDEVGVQFGSDTEKLILFEIINGRYEAVKPTIVISNLAAPALESFLGTRSFDRLREGGGKLVVFDWASYRAKVAA